LNLIQILKELWRRRLLVCLAAILAVALSVFAVFDVSPSPPSISKRTETEARGTISILVDSARSPLADAQRDLAPLSGRAGVLASYMAGGNVISQIAKANEIRPDQIEVSGPTPMPGQAPGVVEEPPVRAPYGIEIVQQGELPVLSVATRAPSTKVAEGLAESASTAVRRVVHRIQVEQEIPPKRRVQFRELGPAEASVVQEAQGKKMAAALFVFLFAAFVAAIVAVPRLITAWREHDAVAPPPADPAQPEGDSEVLHLQAAPGASDDASEHHAARVQRGEH
jgi:hypothetical protein